jgi:hypothetical protein
MNDQRTVIIGREFLFSLTLLDIKEIPVNQSINQSIKHHYACKRARNKAGVVSLKRVSQKLTTTY